MTTANLGRVEWSVSRDNEGHREYTLVSKVQSATTDGPMAILNCPGLPSVGSFWAFGTDYDPWAFCLPTMQVSPVISDEPNQFWKVTQTFSTKPLKRCQDASVEDPLLEPARIGGTFTRYTKVAEKDRDGAVIKSSSHEPIRGIEKDCNRPTVNIELNRATINLGLLASMIDTLNDAPLWGLAAEKIKLSNVSWSRQVYGLCGYYYTIKYDFDISYDGWALTEIVDKGFKVFDSAKYPGTSGDRSDPTQYILWKDGKDDNPPEQTLLDGNGDALTDASSPAFIPAVNLYTTSNFLTLGIPTKLV